MGNLIQLPKPGIQATMTFADVIKIAIEHPAPSLEEMPKYISKGWAYGVAGFPVGAAIMCGGDPEPEVVHITLDATDPLIESIMYKVFNPLGFVNEIKEHRRHGIRVLWHYIWFKRNLSDEDKLHRRKIAVVGGGKIA